MRFRLEITPTLTSGPRMSGKIGKPGLKAMPYFNLQNTYRFRMFIIETFTLKEVCAYTYEADRDWDVVICFAPRAC